MLLDTNDGAASIISWKSIVSDSNKAVAVIAIWRVFPNYLTYPASSRAITRLSQSFLLAPKALLSRAVVYLKLLSHPLPCG
jgi:hypothetical protein